MLPPHQQLVSETTTTHPSTPHLSHIRRRNTEGEHEDNGCKGASVIFLVFILLTAVAATGFDANTVEYGWQRRQQLPMTHGQQPAAPPTRTRMVITTANEEDDCDNCHSATTFSNHTLQHERTHTLIFKGGSFAITHHHHSQFATTTTWHPPQTITTLRHEHIARFQGWWLFASTSTSHHPRARARMLVFEGGCDLQAPPPTTLEHKHVHSCLRVVAICHHLPPPLNASMYTRRVVVVCHYHLPLTTTLEYECSCSFSRVVTT